MNWYSINAIRAPFAKKQKFKYGLFFLYKKKMCFRPLFFPAQLFSFCLVYVWPLTVMWLLSHPLFNWRRKTKQQNTWKINFSSVYFIYLFIIFVNANEASQKSNVKDDEVFCVIKGPWSKLVSSPFFRNEVKRVLVFSLKIASHTRRTHAHWKEEGRSSSLVGSTPLKLVLIGWRFDVLTLVANWLSHPSRNRRASDLAISLTMCRIIH